MLLVRENESLGLVQRSLRAIFEKMSTFAAPTISCRPSTPEACSRTDYATSSASTEDSRLDIGSLEHLDRNVLTSGSIKTEFKASFLEIFNDRVYDLLSSADALEVALSVREDARGVYVDGLKEAVVSSAEEAEEILRSGIANRHVASTNMNRTSSRSHAVFTLNIRSEHTTTDGLQKIRLSKFTLVDLAGSERQKKTGENNIVLLFF